VELVASELEAVIAVTQASGGESLEPDVVFDVRRRHDDARGLCGFEHDALERAQARRIEVLELPDSIDGDAVELTRTAEGTTLAIDDMRSVGKIDALEARGEHEGPEYVVRAERLDANLWEIHAAAL
jgi:hypothetical protein